MENRTMMQYFEWYLPADKLFWKRCAAQAAELKQSGIDMVWLPPAYKGANGVNDVGYAVYDTYDLGEFYQKGSVATKYGTKEEYQRAIRVLQEQGIAVLADIVLNHRIGADGKEQVTAVQNDAANRHMVIGDESEITAWTRFTFPGRARKYSGFTWNWTHFAGIDWDASENQGGIYRFVGKSWDKEVDTEFGNYDYLMGADLEMSNPAVVEELKHWGRWYLEMTGVDGFRLDAVKHIRFSFFNEWLDAMRAEAGRELFAVGEYWSGNLDNLMRYLDSSGRRMALFDVPLHMHFHEASCSCAHYDMRNLLQGTLVGCEPSSAVTFVDNHDTQLGQALESWVGEWFKPLAYAFILLREEGYPCVFYGDYYGIPHNNIAAVPGLKRLLRVRKRYAYGEQTDYFDDANVIGWTRAGDAEHEHSGVAVVLSDGEGGEKKMCMGKAFANERFRDCLHRNGRLVELDDDGFGVFPVDGGSASVWVCEQAYEALTVEMP